MGTDTKLKIHSWKECPIDTYYEIVDVIEDESLSPAEKDIKIISILSFEDENKIWDMDITVVRDLIAQSAWINSFDMDTKAKYKKLVLAEQQYTIDTNLEHFTTAQYIDFQTFWAKKDMKNYMHNILACFIIPKGKKYGKDYDVSETANIIRKNLDIQSAQEILFFSQHKYLNLIRALRTYLILTMKAQMRKIKPEKRKMVEEMMEAKWNDIITGSHVWTPYQKPLEAVGNIVLK